MIFVKRSCFSQCSILKTELYYFLIILSYRLDNYPLDMWISLLINSLEAVVIDTRLYCINIDHYFRTVTNSEMVGVKKPNPKIFSHALQMARAEKNNSVMIGDNYEADILGALNFGLDAICFNYHKEQIDENIKQIDNLEELRAFF